MATKKKVIPASEPTPAQKFKELNKELASLTKEFNNTVKALADAKASLPEAKAALRAAEKVEAEVEKIFNKADADSCRASDETASAERTFEDINSTIENCKSDCNYLQHAVADTKEKIKAILQVEKEAERVKKK
jgi:chromosome segregation ATPase